MIQTFNVYCDESCHQENDRQKAMVLGAIWCPLEKVREIAVRIREIKGKHSLAPDFEIKWVKVSPGKIQFYLDIMDYFFDDGDLHFRALIVPDKSIDIVMNYVLERMFYAPKGSTEASFTPFQHEMRSASSESSPMP